MKRMDIYDIQNYAKLRIQQPMKSVLQFLKVNDQTGVRKLFQHECKCAQRPDVCTYNMYADEWSVGNFFFGFV